MAFAYFDRVKETSTTTGTGAFALTGAVSTFQSFSAVYANGDTLHYVIVCGNTGQWEVGLGTWLTGDQLQRTTVLASSSSDAIVNFGAGSKEVFVAHPAAIESLQGARFFSKSNATARDAIPAATLQQGSICRLYSDGTFWIWTGSAWASFNGFAPVGSATGQVQVWNQSLGLWQAGAVDLADPDAVANTLPPARGGTGISGAGGTPNRVLLTTDGSSWVAGLVTAAMISGTIPFSSLPNGDATSVLGRSANTSGPVASIDSIVDGTVLRRAGGVLGFGAVDLADPDAVAGLLPGTNVDPLFGTRNISTTGTASFGKTTITPLAEVGGSPYALRITGALHTALAAGTQAPDLDINLARTVQFSTGALVSQRAIRVQAPTYSFVGASTISTAATLAISGAPAAGANSTITNALALWVEGGTSRFDGAVTVPSQFLSFGSAPPNSGTIRLTNGQTISSTTSLLVDAPFAYVTGNTAVFGNSALTALINGGSIRNQIAGNDTVTITANQVLLLVSSLNFTTTLGVAPTISQIALTAASGTGQTLTVAAQDANSGSAGLVAGSLVLRGGDCTGTAGTRQGGAVTLRSGIGQTGDGDLIVQRGNTTLITLNKPSGGVVLGLLRNGAVTSTQMPANTGDDVLFIGDATTAPTSGFPTSGGILFQDANLGLQGKGKNGVETTLIQTGDSGNTTKRRLIDWKTQPQKTLTTNTTIFTAASFDVSSFNGQALSNGLLQVRARFQTIADNNYAVAHEITAVVIVASGVVTIGATQDSRFAINNNSPLASATIDNSGTVVRLRLALSTGGGATQMTTFAFLQVTGFES